MPSNCQAKHLLGFKLGDFINYHKAYLYTCTENIRLPAPSEMFWVDTICFAIHPLIIIMQLETVFAGIDGDAATPVGG